jgi:hypothetical protein
MHGAHEEGVAVGRGLGCHRSAHRAAGAALVVDDDLAAELLGQHRGERPREGVGAATGRERHDDGDGLVGPARLRPGRTADQAGAGQRRQQGKAAGFRARRM